MYEVAILLSDRPKDLATQMENGNYRVLLENKVCWLIAVAMEYIRNINPSCFCRLLVPRISTIWSSVYVCLHSHMQSEVAMIIPNECLQYKHTTWWNLQMVLVWQSWDRRLWAWALCILIFREWINLVEYSSDSCLQHVMAAWNYLIISLSRQVALRYWDDWMKFPHCENLYLLLNIIIMRWAAVGTMILIPCVACYHVSDVLCAPVLLATMMSGVLLFRKY